MIITYLDRAGRVLYTGDHADEAEAAAHCARQRVSLAGADLRGVVWDGADLSGIRCEHSDMRGASLRGVTATGPRDAEFSACVFDADTVISGTMTHANFACAGTPGRFRVETGPRTRLRGCNWDACPDVIRMPVRDDRVGQVYAMRNGTGWKVCAGERGVMAEAQAKTVLCALPDVGARYVAAFAYLESPEVVQRKAEIEARPDGAAIVDGGARTR